MEEMYHFAQAHSKVGIPRITKFSAQFSGKLSMRVIQCLAVQQLVHPRFTTWFPVISSLLSNQALLYVTACSGQQRWLWVWAYLLLGSWPETHRFFQYLLY